MHLVRIGLIATAFAGTASVTGIVAARFPHNPAPLVVHEWGTITTVHSPSGVATGCLNRIAGSDPLPDFVHRYEPSQAGALGGTPSVTQAAGTKRVPLVKGPLVGCRPDVTMRLETPVIYFHPAAGASSIPPFDVNVHFRGGVLNEFYPNAAASMSVDADAPSQTWNGDLRNNSVIGELHWRGLSLIDSVAGPQTDAHVWLAPRAVHAASVRTKAGEEERYLFYRGVAHLDAVIRTQRSGMTLRILPPTNTDWMRGPTAEIGDAWLFDIRANGTAAFRHVGSLEISKRSSAPVVATVPLFDEQAYSSSAIANLRAAMHRSLVAAGLNADEASAMLETWSNSYFHTPGERLFYLVPRDWTDYFLPLDISVPSTITRVLVGRVELLEY